MNLVQATLLVVMVTACSGGAASRPPLATPLGPPGEATLLLTVPSAEQGPGAVFALAGDARHLFWTTAAGIVAAGPDGRGPRTLVAGVDATELTVEGDRLLYRDLDGARWSVAVAGGAPRAVAAGDALEVDPTADVRASDAKGTVTVAELGAALLVATADEPPRLHLARGPGRAWLPRRPVLSADAIVAADVTPEGDVGIWRLPRDPAGAPVLLDRTGAAPREPVAAGAALYVIESPEGEGGADDVLVERLVRIDLDGHRTSLATEDGFAALDATPTGVAYAIADADTGKATIWLAEPGAPARALVRDVGPELVGLALAPRAVFWIADGAIWTAPRAGGLPTRFHEPTWGDAGGSGRVHLVIDGSTVYFSSVGLGATGVHRSRGGADATELWPPPADGMGDELVQVGGALFVVVGRRTVWRIPMSGAAATAIYTPDGDAEVTTIAGGGGRVYAATTLGEVVAIDATTGAASTFLHLGDDGPALAADDEALYLVGGDHGWIIRAPHARH